MLPFLDDNLSVFYITEVGARACVRACVCVREREREREFIHINFKCIRMVLRKVFGPKIPK